MIATITKQFVNVKNAENENEHIYLEFGDQVMVKPNERIPNAKVDVLYTNEDGESTTVHNVPKNWFAMVAVYRTRESLGIE